MNNGAVWKYDPRSEKWQDISPVKVDPDKGAAFGYAAVSVDQQNPKHLIVSTFNRPVAGSYAEDDIYRTTDGGKTGNLFCWRCPLRLWQSSLCGVYPVTLDVRY